MAFSANPLSLSVPEPAFESWLRDSGYLEILDERTTNLDRSSSSSSSSDHHHRVTNRTTGSTTTVATVTTTTNGFFSIIFSYLGTFFSLFTLNPFAKLTTDDFGGETPSWTYGFIGLWDSYSLPSSPSQARLRVQENLKRYARNYATLSLLLFACTLYQMPLALFGLISCLALWDLFRFCNDRWRWERYPSLRQSLLRTTQCATAIILYCTNVQLSLFCAIAVSYAVMLLHATLRKLTPAKQVARVDGNKRSRQNKI
ncbi:PREDICTED: PRA1 family protein H [Nelumbo nucifera]|uniref:PRA1 family protein n=2 Tax=Nelumbo nucifera TaxID=4432 RepID=A0A1U8AW27_NELNU|nr:PREDICTED: PRA1 family protein H [Nelumbo nucifera]DAD21013.1 TPA_asm: hypothetical protein HUJ06_022476 [Nelumbo nucifera]